MLLRSVILLFSWFGFSAMVGANTEGGDEFSLALTQALKSVEESGEVVDCNDKLPMLLAEGERDQIKRDFVALMLDDYAGFLSGKDSLTERFLDSPYKRDLPPEVLVALEQARDRISQNSFVLHVDFSAWMPSLIGRNIGNSGFSKASTPYAACVFASMLVDHEYLGAERIKIQEFLEGLSDSSSIDYFDVELKSCRVTNQLNTGNQFANPEAWEGSRFLVLDVAFKNKDKESRIPLPGSAFISVDGSIYEFDQPESIMARGYGVPLQGINPLVTYRTKLVYRVPDESFSDIFWQPGRNSEGKRLYCRL